MNNIIAISGSHGTGKTTFVYKKYEEMKTNNPSNNVGILLEVARKCPFSIFSKDNNVITKESQLWIYSEQFSTELMMSNSYDYIISDRSIIDIIAYTMEIDNANDIVDGMIKSIKWYINKYYNKIYFMTIRNNNQLIDDGVRNLDVEFRQRIEDRMLYLYKLLGITTDNKLIIL